MMKNPWWSWFFKIAGSLIILWVLFRLIEVDYEDFIQQLQGLNISKYLISLSGVVVVLAVKSYRWYWIIRDEGYHYPPGKSFGAYMASYTIGIITPGRIGEIARLYYLRQNCNVGFVPAFRTIVTDRIFDLGVLFMMAIGGLLHFGPWKVSNTYLAVLLGVAIFFLGLYSAAYFVRWMLKRERFKKLSFVVFLDETISPAIGIRSVKLWLITIIAYVLFYIAIQFIFQAIAIQMPLIDIAIILSVVGLATILPISWAGFGTREMTLVYLLAFYGIPAETALGFSLLQFVAFFLWGSMVGLVFWLMMPVSLKQISEDGKKLRQILKKRKTLPLN